TAQVSGISNNLDAVTFRAASADPAIWVAVGAAGALITSPDAIAWTTPTQASVLDLSDVSTVGDKLVAVGELGITVQSTDGATWTQIASGINAFLHGTAIDSGVLVAVGENGVIAI